MPKPIKLDNPERIVVLANGKKAQRTVDGYKMLDPEPYDPENLHISRDEFIAKRRRRQERQAKVAAFEDTLDKPEETQAKKEISKKGTSKKKK